MNKKQKEFQTAFNQLLSKSNNFTQQEYIQFVKIYMHSFLYKEKENFKNLSHSKICQIIVYEIQKYSPDCYNDLIALSELDLYRDKIKSLLQLI